MKQRPSKPDKISLTIAVGQRLTQWDGKPIELRDTPADEQPTVGSALLDVLTQHEWTDAKNRFLAGAIGGRISEALAAGADYVAGQAALRVLQDAVEQTGARLLHPWVFVQIAQAVQLEVDVAEDAAGCVAE